MDITPEPSSRQTWNSRYYEKNRAKILAHAKKKHAANPGKTWARDILYKFGITVEQYDALLLKQGGCCAICGGQQVNGRKRLDVDHDHKTKKVRGLLCGLCNRAVGMLKDDLSRAQKLIEYLGRSHE